MTAVYKTKAFLIATVSHFANTLASSHFANDAIKCIWWVCFGLLFIKENYVSAMEPKGVPAAFRKVRFID